MNHKFFGDSYDLVKRFFINEMKVLGYQISVEPFFTDVWNQEDKDEYHKLISAADARVGDDQAPSAVLLDPDTGVKNKGSNVDSPRSVPS